MYERFTDRSRKVMQFANQEAQRFQHECIGTEHILLGLVKEGAGVASNILKNLDIDLRKIRVEVEKRVHSGSQISIAGKLPQTPRTKKVIEWAIETARSLGHNYVGTEHLLIALVREKEGVAYDVLRDLGATEEVLISELQILFGNKLPSDFIKELQLEKEKAVCEQDFQRASEIRDRLKQMQTRETVLEKEEDTEAPLKNVLKRIACALFLHFTGEFTAKRTIEEIRQILN